MAICASGEKLLHEATGTPRGRVYPVAKNCPRSRTEVRPTALPWPMTFTFNPRWPMVMTHTQTKTQVHRSDGSKDWVETKWRTLWIALASRLTMSVTTDNIINQRDQRCLTDNLRPPINLPLYRSRHIVTTCLMFMNQECTWPWTVLTSEYNSRNT